MLVAQSTTSNDSTQMAPMVFAGEAQREATRQAVRAQLDGDASGPGDGSVPLEFERRIRTANERMAMALGVSPRSPPEHTDLPGGYCPCVHIPRSLGGHPGLQDAMGAEVAETTASTEEGVPPAPQTAGGVAAARDLQLHAEVAKLRAELEKEKLKNAGRATAS